MSREGRSQPIQPSAWHGFVDPGPGPVGTTPPPVTVVPLDADRHHLRPALQAFYAGVHGFATPPAFVAPPPLVVTPLSLIGEDATESTSGRGFADSGVGTPGTTPPPLLFVPITERRAKPLDAIVVRGVISVSAPTVAPPSPLFVPIADLRSRQRALLAPIVLRGPTPSGAAVAADNLTLMLMGAGI